MAIPLKATGGVSTTPNPRTCNTSAHVNFSRVAHDFSHGVRKRCVSPSSRSHVLHSMSHAPSLLFPSHLNTTSLSTCTPIRPSIRPPTRPSLLSTSHGDLPCADPSNVSFGPVAETHSPTGYEPRDLTEEDNSFLVKPMFFQSPSRTSTYDSGESIATSAPELDLDDEQIRNMLESPLYLQEREVTADRSRVHHSFEEPSVSSSSHFRESARKPAVMFSNKKKVESTNNFRQRGHFLRTSTGSRKRRKFIQVLRSQRSCEISSERSSTRRSKIWNLEARMYNWSS